MNSILTRNQFKTITRPWNDEKGHKGTITAEIRYDDRCGNKHNSFSITGHVICKKLCPNDWLMGGCIHEEIAKFIPELKPYFMWHGCNTGIPFGYFCNTLYHVSNRDYNGLLEGESKQIHKGGDLNKSCWRLEEVSGPKSPYAKGLEPPTELPVFTWVPHCIIGTGKIRDLNAARQSAFGLTLLMRN